MKKSISVLVLLAIVATCAFAQGVSTSVGGGLLFDWSSNNGKKWEVPLLGTKHIAMRNLSFGGYGFFDFTYAELDVSFAYGSLATVSDITGTSDSGNVWQLGFSLLGKYPIGMGRFTLFPLFGADYNIVLSWNLNGNSYDNPGDLNQFGLLAGLGADFGLSRSTYLRAEGLFHLRFASKFMDDLAVGGTTTLGIGPRIKVGVGCKI